MTTQEINFYSSQDDFYNELSVSCACSLESELEYIHDELHDKHISNEQIDAIKHTFESDTNFIIIDIIRLAYIFSLIMLCENSNDYESHLLDCSDIALMILTDSQTIINSA